jgi:hypothetical protein
MDQLTIGDSSWAGKLHVGAPFDEQAFRVLKRPARLGISSVRGEIAGAYSSSAYAFAARSGMTD